MEKNIAEMQQKNLKPLLINSPSSNVIWLYYKRMGWT